MRQWHRWLVVFFAPFMLWMAGTGLASHIVPLFERAAAKASDLKTGQPAIPPGFKCPVTMNCRPKTVSIVGTLHDLHSGKSFGPVGTALSILSGTALLFFAGSGLWMYAQMWRGRARLSMRPRWFW